MKFRIEYDTENGIRIEEKEYGALTDAVAYAQEQVNRCDWPPAMEPKCARVYMLDADGGYDENSYVPVEFTKKMEDVVFEIVFIRDDGGATNEVVGREKKEFDDFEQGVGYVHEKMESLEWPERPTQANIHAYTKESVSRKPSLYRKDDIRFVYAADWWSLEKEKNGEQSE